MKKSPTAKCRLRGKAGKSRAMNVGLEQEVGAWDSVLIDHRKYFNFY